MKWFSKNLFNHTQRRTGPSCEENNCGFRHREITLAEGSISRFAMSPKVLAVAHFFDV